MQSGASENSVYVSLEISITEIVVSGCRRCEDDKNMQRPVGMCAGDRDGNFEQGAGRRVSQ